MMEGEEFTQQDANTQESSAPESSETSNETSTTPQVQEALEQKPFHEDPRVQEYIERQIARKTAAVEQQIAEMQRRMSESPKAPAANATHPFVQKLTEIDPKFGEWATNQEKAAQEMQEFRQWRAEQEQQVLVQKYESGIEKLHADNKVPKEFQEFYKAQLDAEASRNPKLTIKDLPDVYKTVHERISKVLRANTASYVKDKAQDAKVPTSPKGGKTPSTKGEKPKFGSKDDMYASIVKTALKTSNAEGDL